MYCKANHETILNKSEAESWHEEYRQIIKMQQKNIEKIEKLVYEQRKNIESQRNIIMESKRVIEKYEDNAKENSLNIEKKDRQIAELMENVKYLTEENKNLQQALINYTNEFKAELAKAAQEKKEAKEKIKELTEKIKDQEARSIWRQIMDTWDNYSWWQKGAIIASCALVAGSLGFATSYFTISSVNVAFAEAGFLSTSSVISATRQLEVATSVAMKYAGYTGGVLTLAAMLRECLLKAEMDPNYKEFKQNFKNYAKAKFA